MTSFVAYPDHANSFVVGLGNLYGYIILII